MKRLPLVVMMCLSAESATLPAPLAARPLGAQARATIGIRASVLPRFMVQADPRDATRPLAIVSNAPGLRVRLVAGQRDVVAMNVPGRATARNTGRPASVDRAEPKLFLIVPD